MIRLDELRRTLEEDGYKRRSAESRICQDIVLEAIKCGRYSRNITVKGGVVMRNIANDFRRATLDLDLDFVHYSLDDTSIQRFIEELNCIEGITIRIKGEIENLELQEYHGKRVYITVTDSFGVTIKSKIDFGVHKKSQIEQDELCFDVCMDDNGVCLLANSKEQIFTEKLRSLLKFGPLSTRYKDIFDMCFLSHLVDKERLMRCMDAYIFSDPGIQEKDMNAVKNRVSSTFENQGYRQQIELARRDNWMGVPAAEAMKAIEDFLATL